MIITRGVMAVGLLAGLAGPAFPCSVTGLSTPSDLVQQAEVIVRVRVQGLSSEPGTSGTMASSRTQVEFEAISILKGSLPARRMTFNGWLVQRDERNPGPVPYEVARHSADASCFSLAYRAGGDYLLFLKRAGHPTDVQGEQLTPCWAPLSPSNEQVLGDDDPWERWVRERLRILAAAKPGD